MAAKARKSPAKHDAVTKPRRANATARTARAHEVHLRMSETLPSPPCELDFRNPWELLVATILSAQSTDKMVNKVTPALFAAYPTPAALADAPQEAVETLVKSTGFFHNKAKNIRATAALVAREHGGEVPRTVEALVALPGVAKKTANVVLGTAFRISSGITVDTHVGRVARRLELTREEDPVKVERDLCALFPTEAWIDTGHRLVLHGRYTCLARAPACARCPLNDLCPAADAAPAMPYPERVAHERALVERRGAPDTNAS